MDVLSVVCKKQKAIGDYLVFILMEETGYRILSGLEGSEMCVRSRGPPTATTCLRHPECPPHTHQV